MKPYDLIVVMPVYNEAEAIGPVLKKWQAMLDTLNIRYQIRAYNDGSKDNTGAILKEVSSTSDGRILGVDKANSGHGPTILRGYREAAREAEWVFQIDSDDEMGPESFPKLWAMREAYDFLVGQRDGRRQPLPRKIISFVSRLCVRIFYGKGIWDVNTPYRLMRAEAFQRHYEAIPDNTFAPNVILSGLAARNGLRMTEIPVPQHDRTTGEVSIKKWKLLKAAAKSFKQTIDFSFADRTLGTGGNAFWRCGGMSIALVGVVGGCFLLCNPYRLSLIPIVACMLLFILFWKNSASGTLTLRWIGSHPYVCLSGIIGVGLVLRIVGAIFLSAIDWPVYSDYITAWKWANSFAEGLWPDSKSWTTVLFYGSLIKAFGPSELVAFVGTCCLKVVCFLVAFYTARCWVGTIGALIWSLTLSLSIVDIIQTSGIATEHTYMLGLLLSVFFLTKIYGCCGWGKTTFYSVAFGVAAWFTLWSRGEGVLLWILAPGLILMAAIGRQLQWRKAAVFLFVSCVVAVIGAKVAFTVNEAANGTRTIFCSSDNLWPRLFGANLATQGRFNLSDYSLIRERFRAEHPGEVVPAGVSCPEPIVPYIKQEIAARWHDMTTTEMFGLLCSKAQCVWLSSNPARDSKSGTWIGFGERLLADALPTLLFVCTVLFFVVALLRGGAVPHPLTWAPILFVAGNAAILMLSEALSRYSFSAHLLLGLYAGGVVAIVTGTLPIRGGNGRL